MSHRKTDDKANKALDAQIDSGEDEELESQVAINQAEMQNSAAKLKQEVQSFLQRGSAEDAMKAACKISSKEVIEILVPVFNDIVAGGKLASDKFVNSLNANELDVCMKYIYKSMELLTKGTSVNISNVLALHEKVVQAAGVGAIVRVISDTN
eukprot:NODE_4_length_77007_cov_1.156642.p63 type:complete len:153 gc:universal NODE_4_length_77007_cov_1.156642:41165-41623(+)